MSGIFLLTSWRGRKAEAIQKGRGNGSGLLRSARNDEEREEINALQQKAWVVFSGQADLPWLRLLRPGFRHCFVLLHDGRTWLTVDPMLHHMDVHTHHHLPADFDLPRWLENRGQKVIEARLERTQGRPAPWSLFTCVEAAKRILGIHARFIITPWQLYRYLTAK